MQFDRIVTLPRSAHVYRPPVPPAEVAKTSRRPFAPDTAKDPGEGVALDAYDHIVLGED
jgi:hypothetical protein